jgi:hypothetical protein
MDPHAQLETCRSLAIELVTVLAACRDCKCVGRVDAIGALIMTDATILEGLVRVGLVLRFGSARVAVRLGLLRLAS